MTGRQLASSIFCTALFGVALWLLADVGWRVALGVFLFVWANNIVYSYRIKKLVGL